MVLQHNVPAINSGRNLSCNRTNLNKNLENLSTGYKINRAADDAAGLAISESMRNKINGLNQAEINAQDGISMIQIAEGALSEVHSMLERGTTLATQAANDTYKDDVRKNIDAELQELKKEIDRISASTEFNGINLLNGLHAAGEIDKVASVLTTDEVDQIVKDISNIVCNSGEDILNSFNTLKTGYPTSHVNITIKGLPGSTLATAGGTVSSGQGLINVNVDVDKIDSINTATKESTLSHEVMHGVMGVALANAGTSMSALQASDNLWFIEGTAQLAGGIFTAGWNTNIRANASASLTTDSERIAHMKNALGKHGSPTGEVYGTGALMTAYIGYLASGSAAPDGTINLGVTGNAAKISSGINKIFNEIINNHKSLEDAIYATTGKTESELMGHFSGSSSNDNFVNFLINVAQESGVNGSGSVVTGLGSSISNPSYYTNYTGTHFIVDNVNTTNFGTGGGDVTLQIGPSSSETITIFRFDMTSEGLGLGDTNVLTRSNASQAIESLRSAVSYTSSTRAYFGAKQNRLEHTINNLKISNENVTSAESRIRDTDMAKEITKYTKNNILLQASQSMLAQANQTPQGVLALLG